MIIEKSSIHILGRVSKANSQENPYLSDGYFIGYVSKDFPMGSIFELDGSYIKLNAIYLDGKIYSKVIPSGYKSVCKFSYTESISEKLESLPEIDSWSNRSKTNRKSFILPEITKKDFREKTLNKLLK